MSERTLIGGAFEAKKHGYRQTQDGCVVSFVVHPNDISPEFAAAPLGTPFQVGYQEYDPDAKEPPAEKPKRERKLSEIAALRCKNRLFQQFLRSKDAEQANQRLKALCDINSKTELDQYPEHASNREMFYELDRQFHAYKAEHQYPDNLERERAREGVR